MPARAAAPTPSPPPAAPMVIDIDTVSGSGCPPGTVLVTVAPDNTRFSLIYNSYFVQVGVGAGPIDFRKNCQAVLAVRPPAGFTLAISRVDHMGYAFLADGATGIHQASHHLKGEPRPALISHPLTGPMDDLWQATDEVLIEPVYFPCGTTPSIVLDTTLRVSAGTSDPQTTTSFVSLDAVDISYSSSYLLDWATC
ncbi:DUF4360 domain-containing protein [Plantactinospora sp. ZYX-F-223]|uniref:DUF4360 domain-containing protein n=1 Tax=Plantactinospora sp. ZYX-F-223 TaxID=3144103 RepID=UPI0031FC8C01